MFIVLLEFLYEVVPDIEGRFSVCFGKDSGSLSFLVIKDEVARNIDSDVRTQALVLELCVFYCGFFGSKVCNRFNFCTDSEVEVCCIVDEEVVRFFCLFRSVFREVFRVLFIKHSFDC